MAKRNAVAVTTGVVMIMGLPLRRQLTTGVKLGVRRWKTDPKATGIDIGASLVGQLLFWTIGQDFIGVGMRPKWLPGLGHKLAAAIQPKLPQTARVAWTIKVIEIASDATKIPIEGRLYREQGVVPDAVAAAVTQPLWSTIEVGEKLFGVIMHPERVNTPEQVADSISSIYGTWTRNILSLILWRYGPRARSWLRHPQPVLEPTAS